MANVVDILIKAKDQTSGAFKSAEKNMKGLDDAAETSKSKSMSFADSWSMALLGINQAIGIARAAVEGFKQILEFSKEGAQIEFTKTKFDNLALSIGTTADALVMDLREATRGTMSDMELMDSATQMMGLGLAKTHDEAVRLATVAGALGMNMNQLVLTLTNQTTMRFDALGVSVDGFDAKVKQLEETGLSASEAFQEAFLQQAEEQIKRVGNAADSAVGDWQRLEAAQANYFNNVKENTVGFAQTWARTWTEVFSFADAKMTAEEMIETLQEMGVSVADIEAQLGDTAFVNGEMYYDAELAVENLTEEYGYLFDEIESNQLYDGSFSDAAIVAAGAMGTAALSTQEFADAAADAAAAYYDYVTTVDDGIETQQIATEGTRAARDAMREYNEQLLFTIASEGMNEDQALSLAIAMGLVDESTMAATAEIEFLRQRKEAGIITTQQYEDAILRLQDAIDGLTDKEVEIRVNIGGTGVSLLSGIADIKVGNLGDLRTGYREAAGGVVHAASGMAMQAPYLVGEVGPEPFFPAVDGRILSNSQAMSALRSGGRSASVVNVTINTPVNFADRVWVENELAPYIRSEIEKVSL